MMALDALRALTRNPATFSALAEELAAARGGDARLDRHGEATLAALGAGAEEASARRICEDIALAVQGALLVRFAPACVADAFCASRLGGTSGRAFGALPPGLDLAAIVARAGPGVD
jgi:putative acyl-CoA dehydrogenase